jgi:NADH-quinone oxidoreductase subunit N
MPTGPFVTGVAAVDWVALAPVLVTAAGAVLVLGLDAVLGRSRGRAFAVLAAVALGSVLIAMASLVPLASGVRQTFCDPAGACGYVASHLTFALQVVILSGALVVLLLVLDEPDGPGAGRRPESLMLILAATSGACALAGARDLATLVVALETASLPVVGLVGLPGGRRAAEAATKLLLTTVTSFGLLSLGAALVYASTGSLHLRAPVAGALGDLTAVHGVGLALLVAGAAFKLSLVPFHLWTPDTYAGASWPAAAFLSTVSKGAGLAAVVLVLAVAGPERSALWAPLVGGLAVLTMTVGNLIALQQTVAVRLLAWSTVAQAGWVLLPMSGGGDPAAVAASVGYLLAYGVGTLAVFAVVALLAPRHPGGAGAHGTGRSGGGGHRLSAYHGLWRRRPGLALVLAFGLLCLAGLPPGVMGLVAKVAALAPAVDAGAWGTVGVAVANVALGVAVYLRWLLPVFTGGPAGRRSTGPGSTGPGSTGPGSAGPGSAGPGSAGSGSAGSGSAGSVAGRLAVSITAAACVALSVLPEGVVGLLGDAPLR